MPGLFPLQGLCNFEEDFLRGLQSRRDGEMPPQPQGRALSTFVVASLRAFPALLGKVVPRTKPISD